VLEIRVLIADSHSGGGGGGGGGSSNSIVNEIFAPPCHICIFE